MRAYGQVLQVLRWMMQKDQLGQDMLLLGYEKLIVPPDCTSMTSRSIVCACATSVHRASSGVALRFGSVK
jgi:hypothetical protein